MNQQTTPNHRPSINHPVDLVQHWHRRHAPSGSSTMEVDNDVIVYNQLVHRRQHVTENVEVCEK